MRTELPVCKRCCFCFPLRYGLITWGYLKLVTSCLLVIFLSVTLYGIVGMFIMYKNSYHIQNIVIVSIILLVLLADVALNTIFIVGGHTKNVKLLRVYYIYNIVLWALTVLLVLMMTYLMIKLVILDGIMYYRTWIFLLDCCSSFISILSQTYFLLLLRSEIMKLSNNCEFRFVNNAAEAECNMNYYYKEGLVDEEADDEFEDICDKTTCGPENACEKTCQFKGSCHKNVDIN